MKKASEYRMHAEECRSLARAAQNEDHRSQLIVMATTWDLLADEREVLISKHPELAKDLPVSLVAPVLDASAAASGE